MKLKQILTYRKKVECTECGELYYLDFQSPDEGFGHAAQLYHCANCFHPYFHSLESQRYLGPLSSTIESAICNNCSTPLKDSLEKVSFIGSCPSCSSRKYRSIERAVENYVEVEDLYS